MPKDVRIIPAQGSIDFSLSQGFITSLIQLTNSGTLSIASTGPIQIGASNTVAIQIVSNNFVGINTVSPTQNLHVQGNLRLTGSLYDSTNSPGTANQLLISTGSGIAWTSVNVTGILTASGGLPNRVSKFLDEDTLGNSNITDTGTQITLGSATSVSGILTSFGFFGPGTSLTNLNASNLVSGTVPSAVVSGTYSGITSVGNLTQLNVTGVTTSNGFFGPGTNLTNLNASNLASGTVPSAVVSGTYSGITSVGNLTQLNVTGVTTSNGFFGPGTNLTNLNASSLASGTVPSAVVSGTYSGITSVGNLTQLNVTGITTLQNLELNGWLLDANNSAGAVNQILSSTGSGIAWTSVNTTGIITASGGTPNRVTKFLDEDTIANSNITDTGTQITLGSATSVSGILTSFGFFGPGTNLTNLNASNLASGTVPSSVVSGSYSGITSVGNLTQLNVTGVTTSNGFFGPGTNLTNLNASNLTSGTVPSSVVSGSYSGITSVGNLTQLNVTGITTLQNLELNGWLLDVNNSSGLAGQILSSTGSGIAWSTISATGILTGSGITNNVPKFGSPTSLTTSNITDNGIAVTVNSRLNVVGIGSFTTDIIVNQITVGLGSNNVLTNVALGYQALLANPSSSTSVVAIGYQAMSNVSGSWFGSIAIGQAALQNNQGSRNVAIGVQALAANTTGASNIAIGYQALQASTTDGGNIAIGNRVMYLLTGGGGGGNIAIGGAQNLTTAGEITVVGASAANNYTSQGQHVAIGAYALGGVSTTTTTGTQNTAVGYAAMTTITSGSANVGLGHNALNTLTSGNSNTALGYLAAVTNTTGSLNVAVGREALRYYSTVSNQVAIGYQALAGSATTTLNTGTQNTAVGYQAGAANTSGFLNTYLGYQAGAANASGTHNTYVGTSAGVGNTSSHNTIVGANSYNASGSGTANVVVGSLSAQSNTSGNYNTAIGYNVFNSNTTGSNNAAFGFLALASNVSGDANVAIGRFALRYYQTATGQVAIGDLALQGNSTVALNTGTQNTALGYAAGAANTSGSRNTFVGYQAGLANTSGSDNNSFGNESLKANTTGNFNNAYGNYALVVNTSGQFNNAFGYQALYANTTGGGNVAFGHVSMQNSTTGSDNTAVGALSLVSNTTGSNNVAIGRETLRYYEAGNQTAIGYQALRGNSTTALNTGTDNTAIGYQAGLANSSGNQNVFIGHQAGLGNTSGYQNIAIGYQAMLLNNTGFRNTAVGRDALYNNTSGSDNVAFGVRALYTNSTGSNNAAFGFFALNQNTTGTLNVAVGPYALEKYRTTSNNVAIGYNALNGNVDTTLNTGNTNVAIGSAAGLANTSGSNNVFVGQQAGTANTSGSQNTYIGKWAGLNMTTGSNNTFIGDSSDGAQGSNYQIAMGRSVVPTASNLGAWGGNTNATRTDLGVGTFTPLSRLHLETLAAGNMGLYIAGSASQTADLVEVNATTGGANYFTINGIGSVGILTATPTQYLDVNATTRLRGRLFDVNNSAGTQNQVLISTGTGISWTTATSTGIVTGTGTINTLSKFNSANSLTNSNITDTGTQITLGSATSVSGILTSFGFFGPGTNLTNLNASNLASGTVPSAVVSGTYSGITSVGNLTQLNVTGITTLQNLELNGWLLDANNSAGSVNQILSSTGSGIAWTSVNTTGIITASGGTPNRVTKFLDEDTIANSNITDTGTQITLGSATSVSGILTSFGYFGPGTNLTNLNASNLASGTVPSSVVSGSYSGITSVGNLTQLNVTGITTLQNLELNGWLLDVNNSAGVAGQILSSTGSGIAWSTVSAIGILTGSGVTNNVPKFGSPTSLTTSNITDNGIAVTVGSQIFVNGIGSFTGDITVNSITIGLGSGQITTNTVVGNSALTSNTTGSNNVSVGRLTLNSNVTGAQNVAIGAEALRYYSTASNQTAIGYRALRGSSDTTVNTGTQNLAIGYQAGLFNTSGSNNTYIGLQAGFNNTSGNNNTIIGVSAGPTLTTGGNNTLLGTFADASAGGNYQIAIGQGVIPTASNFGAWGGNTNATRTDLGVGTFTPLGRIHIETLAAGNMGLYIAGAASQTGDLVEINATTNGTNYFTITGVGSVGIFTNTPSQALDVNGATRLRGRLFDNNNSAGSAGQLLASTATGVVWTSATASGIITGIGSINVIPKFGSAFSLTTSNISDSGTQIVFNSNTNTTGLATFRSISLTTSSLTTSAFMQFVGAYNDPITLNVGVATTGSISFNGSQGQLFTITNNLTSGSIFSVNDVSGIPSIDVNASGAILIAPYGGNIGIGTTNAPDAFRVQTTSRFIGLATFGAVNISRNLYDANLSPGTSGQILSSVVNGVAWSSASSLGVVTGSASAGQITFWNGNNSITGLSTFVFANPGIGINTTVPIKSLHIRNNGILIDGASTSDPAGYGPRLIIDSGASTAFVLADLKNNNGSILYVSGSTVSVGNSSVISSTFNVNGGDAQINTLRIGLGSGQVATNTALGVSALAANTTGNLNLAAGYQAGLANTNGTENTFLGYQAGRTNTTGSTNVAVGSIALFANTSGSQNIAVGRAALTANTTGSNNTAAGNGALTANTTASDNTAFGFLALQNNTTGNSNVAVGRDALRYWQTASQQTAVGFGALIGNSTVALNTGTRNTALGWNAGAATSSGTDNVFVGHSAGLANTSGIYNTVVGSSALAANTTGGYNNAFGYQALAASTSADFNNAFGQGALAANTTGTSNSGFGHNALGGNTTGGNNVAIGILALVSNTTSSNNVAIGRSALRYYNQAAQVAVGYEALAGNSTVALNTGTQNTAVGFQAGSANTSGTSNTFVGYQAGLANTSGSENVALGVQALLANLTGTGNVALGQFTLAANTTGSNSTAVGQYALQNNTAGGNSAFGATALRANTTGSENTAVGYVALVSNTTGFQNSALGLRSLQNNTTGGGNVAVGRDALRYYQTSNNQTAVGANALAGNTTVALNTGTQNTALGVNAGVANTSGSNNIFVGFQAGLANTSGNQNTYVGRNSGSTMTTGSNNTILGDSADGAQGSSYQIAIGQGVSPTASNLGVWGGNTNTTRTDLGIGTFTPLARLHLETLASANPGIYIAGSASQTSNLFEIDATTNGSNYLTITGIGSVGIYTSIPAVPFHSYGAARIDNSLTLNATTADTKTQRIFAGASTSTSSTSFVTIASITIPTGFTLNLEAKVNGWVSTALNESGKAFGIFYNNAGTAVQVGTTDVVSKYLGVGGNFDIQTSGANVNIVVKSNSGASTWFWKTQYDYLLSQNS